MTDIIKASVALPKDDSPKTSTKYEEYNGTINETLYLTDGSRDRVSLFLEV